MNGSSATVVLVAAMVAAPAVALTPVTPTWELMAEAMEFLKAGKCIPQIAQELPFANAPEAYKTAASKQGRTLIVMQEI